MFNENFGLDSDNNSAWAIFIDLFANGKGVFILLLLIVLTHVNPVGEKSENEEEPPGNLVVEIKWPDGLNIDIDLWMMAPGEPKPVGYSNLNGRVMNLLRDDLGNYSDKSSKHGGQPMSPSNDDHSNTFETLNYENGYSRGLPPGGYRINVHYYSKRDRNAPPCVPLDYRIIINRKGSQKGKSEKVAQNTVELCEVGEELTLGYFEIENFSVVKNSYSTVFEPLRGR